MKMKINLSNPRTAPSKVQDALKAAHDGSADDKIIGPWTAIGLAGELEGRLEKLGLSKNARPGARGEFTYPMRLSFDRITGLATRLTVERGSSAWFLVRVERTHLRPSDGKNLLTIWITPEQDQRAREAAHRRLGIIIREPKVMFAN